ncbi:MAG: UDP-N-acetylglucosamine-N-acetylmuramyl-(pentapeptide) pyrophosphoryl-undecaprenol N-acetylglucosamine transferase [uncultured bacterium (gcode 4)]|uniref:UDP-N-acetylglucosamine-N-acetylmuramyl-(Pentapeptide) pyrophosphoryl-undecaprenol N-acetylglucosamine transferase n=1 Tax=uncultured bacterium (gcode 4) TaxID=1234023 RepID=K1YYS2_9BACT|nr:MAG: UDP-N-acetylglucosamine-N-acetylmuramyl-(pentapeptide) pyrophosphoryl-undecaprenol N-acetylglucosamine transferase [uncultured bacterium (gcode 4)]
MSKRIALVGGGTGGHVTPIVALSRYIREKHPNTELLWIGEETSMEQRFAEQNTLPFRSISSYRIPSMHSFHKMIPALFRMVRGFFEARTILKQFKPDSLFSKWWPGAISVVLAARSLNIPVYIHDSDVIPGASNRLISRFADHIFLGFEEAKSFFPWKETEVVGQILSPDLPILNTKSDAIHFHSPDKTRVLVICGSQGSRTIHQALVDQMSSLGDFEFIIALGTRNEEFQEVFAQFSNVQAFPWLGESLGDVYREADIIISRGSATTLSEAITFGAKVIAIPLPIAAFDHQRANVRVYEAQWLVTGLEESELSKLWELLKSLAGRRIYTAPRFDILEGVKRITEVLMK